MGNPFLDATQKAVAWASGFKHPTCRQLLYLQSNLSALELENVVKCFREHSIRLDESDSLPKNKKLCTRNYNNKLVVVKREDGRIFHNWLQQVDVDRSKRLPNGCVRDFLVGCGELKESCRLSNKDKKYWKRALSFLCPSDGLVD